MAQPLPGRYTVEEYFRLEQASEIKHEFRDGQIIPLQEPVRFSATAKYNPAMTMPAETTPRRYTLEEYFRLESESEERHEFRDGEIIAMSGGTNNHSLIIANTIGSLVARLRGKPCRVYEGHLRVRIKRKSLYSYPDLSIICDAPLSDPDDPSGESVLDPRVVLEVLSPSTELYNRTKKFERYRENPSFQEYVLISQDRAIIETFFRHPDGGWRFDVKSNLTDIMPLRSIGIDLPLAEVYDRVVFPPPPPEDAPDAPLSDSPAPQ